MRKALFILVVLLFACGRKGPPLPPLREVPETTTDLAVSQEENEVVLRWSYPSFTRSGQPLRDLEAVEVWRTDLPPGQEKSLEGPQGVELKRQLILGRGKLVARLSGNALEAATRGSMLEYREAASLSSGQAAPTFLYAVRSRRGRGGVSEFSNVATFQVQTPPASPANLQAQPLPEGVALSWEGPADAAFRVERWREKEGWQVVGEKVAASHFLDATAQQGSRYAYRVRTTLRNVTGPATPEVKVDYRDIFPPAVPSNLVCLPEPGRVVLRWDPGAEEGVRFKVFRRLGEGSWQHLSDDWPSTSFVDENPPTGELTYAVKAFDRAGNESVEATCTARGGS